MIGAGTFINPLLKIVTTVAILGAVYLFFVKPALDTTEEITNNAIAPISEGLKDDVREINEVADQAGTPVTQTRVRREVSGLTPRQGEQLTACIERAGAELARFNACFDRFERVAARGGG